MHAKCCDVQAVCSVEKPSLSHPPMNACACVDVVFKVHRTEAAMCLANILLDWPGED
jgi:hypothetical protein